MAAAETAGGRRILNRRNALRGALLLGAAAAPWTGAAAGFGEQAVRQPDYFTTKGSEIDFLFLKNPTGQELAKQYSVQGVIRSQARAIADNITPPALNKNTTQGTDWDPRQPEINRMAVAEAALVLAEIQYGIKGREVVAETIQQGGLAVTYEGVKTEQATNGQQKQKPYTITLPRNLMEAHIPFDGLERADRVDDFQLLDSINGFVQTVIQDTATGTVASNGIPAQFGDLGVVAGAAGVATVATSHEAVRRRGLFRWVGVGVVSTAALLAAERLNLGGQMVEVYDAAALGGSALGTDYAHPTDTFKAFFGSKFFGADIKNQLIVQTKVKK